VHSDLTLVEAAVEAISPLTRIDLPALTGAGAPETSRQCGRNRRQCDETNYRHGAPLAHCICRQHPPSGQH